MLDDRDLRILAQIETMLTAEEPGLVRLLQRGGRFALLMRPEPEIARGLVAVCLTVVLGLAGLVVGLATGTVPLVAIGLIGAIVLPLPVWLFGTTRRSAAY